MKNKFSITIIFFLLISVPINNLFSQQIHKILDVPGGSGTTNNSSSSENSKTTLYVIGGAIIVGIVIYSLLKDKKEEPKEDTTAAILDKDYLKQNLTINDKISNMQSQIPINISFGLESHRAIRDEKRYFLGLNYNF